MKALLALAACTACTACGLADGLHGQAGVPLQSTSWHGPVQLDQGLPSGADAPRLVWGQGKAWVTWEAYDAAAKTSSVWLTSRPRGGTWATPQAVPAVPGWTGGSSFPALAIGETGDPVLAFEATSADASPARSIWAARLPGGAVPTASALVRVDATNSRTPQLSQHRSLAVDAAGNAVVAWGEFGGIFAASSTGGSSWTAPLSIDNSTNAGWSSVDLVAGPAGAALLGWSVNSSSLASPLSFSGGVLSAGANKALSTGANLPEPALAVRGSIGLAAFPSGPAIVAQPYAGGIWGAPQTVSPGGVAPYSSVAIAVNARGQAVVVYRGASGGNDAYEGLVEAAFYDGAHWSAPQVISLTGAQRKAWWLAVDLNEAGLAVCSWADFDAGGTYTRIWASVLHVEGGIPVWQGPTPIDQASPGAYLAEAPENVRHIGVSLDPAGAGAYVIWMQHGQGTDTTPHTWANWLE